MPRWTENSEEAKRVLRVNSEIAQLLLEGHFLLSIHLNNGGVVEGRVSGHNIGNNAGECGIWQYYGSVRIKTENSESIDVDYLDIDSVVSKT